MTYVLIQDGEPVRFNEQLPDVWESVSGFHHLTNDQIIWFGWYPYVEQKADPGPGQVLADVVYQIGETQVVGVYAARDQTPEELQSLIDALCSGLDRRRDEVIDGGFSFQGHLYQSDPSSRENIMGKGMTAALAIFQGAQAGDLHWDPSSPDGFAFIDQANEAVPMDAQTMAALFSTGSTLKSDAISAAFLTKKAVRAATSAVQAQAAADAVVWPSNT